MKRIFALLLAGCLVFGLFACGGEEIEDDEEDEEKTEATKEEDATESTGEGSNDDQNNDSNSGTDNNTGNDATVQREGFVFDKDAEVKLGNPAKELDPKQVYANLTYGPEMFMGRYRIKGGEEAEKKYAEEISYVLLEKAEDADEEDYNITAIPYCIEAGKHTFAHVLGGVPGRNFMRAYFYGSHGYMDSVECAYTVSGNTITLNPVKDFKYNEEKNSIRYTMTDVFLTYEFSFSGRNITLSKDGQSVTLHTGLEYSDDNDYIHVDHYSSLNSPKIDGVDELFFRYDDGEGRFSFYMEEPFQGTYGTAVMEENGLLTMTIPFEEGAKTYQFVYFLCADDGIILTDGKQTYYYTADSYDRYNSSLGDNLTVEDAEKLENMDKDKLEEIVEKKADLLTDLAAAFKAAGLNVTINEATGEIALDSAVLFPVSGYAVSNEGKDLLKRFISVYTSVVFDEKYEGFISTIQVEGHTDSTGNYDDNVVLSQNRAESVREYCLSDECGVDAAYLQQLNDSLIAVGYSSDKLVFDSNGNEDKAASRRVCFRFVINLED